MILLIDCSLNYLEVAIIKNQEIIDLIYKKQEKNLTKILIPTIIEIIKKNNFTKNEFNKIFVINGPGSFTSIKLISVFANTWKSIIDIELYELDTCQWHATKKECITYLDAKSNLWYFKNVYENERIKLINSNDLKIELNKNNNLDKINCLNESSIHEKWKYNKNSFKKVSKISPLYIKEAV